MMDVATTDMKVAHLHALASLYYEDGQIDRSLLLLTFASVLAPGNQKILGSLAKANIAAGAVARAAKINELLDNYNHGHRLGSGEGITHPAR